jgi:formate-dependent nitrite reductase membrane component NrfD
VLIAGLRRFAISLFLIGGATLGVALLVAHLSSVPRDRAITLAFIVVGAFMVLGALLTASPMSRPRQMSWQEREQSRAWARVWVALGLSLVVIGLLFDSRHSLF